MSFKVKYFIIILWPILTMYYLFFYVYKEWWIWMNSMRLLIKEILQLDSGFEPNHNRQTPSFIFSERYDVSVVLGWSWSSSLWRCVVKENGPTTNAVRGDWLCGSLGIFPMGRRLKWPAVFKKKKTKNSWNFFTEVAELVFK